MLEMHFHILYDSCCPKCYIIYIGYLHKIKHTFKFAHVV